MKAAAATTPDQQRETWIGVDELNFAEFPLTTIAGELPSGQKTLIFEDDIEDKGAKTRVQRKLVVSASDLYGLPMPRDSDVLLVIIDLTKSVNGFTQRKVLFRRSELLAKLGWDDSGKSYQRLDEALQRWASVTLYYNGAWWDKSVKRWRTKTFHVLEALDLRGREQSGSPDDSLSSFTWNEVVFASFEAGNLRSLDLELYFRLTRPASRQAYRFLAKRFYFGSLLTFELREFLCEHVGYSRSYDNAQLKRKARPMLAELESVGFLAPMEDAKRYEKVARGHWKIRLAEGHLPEATSPRRTSQAEQQLLDRGVQPKIARSLAERFTEDRVLEKVRLHDWLQGRKDQRMSKSTAGFLVRAIREDFRPNDFIAADRPAKKASPGSPRLQQETRADTQQLEHLCSWRTLPADEQTRIEQEAVSTAEVLQQEAYLRLAAGRGRLFVELRNELVSRYLQRRATAPK